MSHSLKNAAKQGTSALGNTPGGFMQQVRIHGRSKREAAKAASCRVIRQEAASCRVIRQEAASCRVIRQEAALPGFWLSRLRLWRKKKHEAQAGCVPHQFIYIGVCDVEDASQPTVVVGWSTRARLSPVHASPSRNIQPSKPAKLWTNDCRNAWRAVLVYKVQVSAVAAHTFVSPCWPQ